ncbi:MAG: Arc family DNA-binding protein [Noviherbaspirillum sp.]
MPTQKQQQNSYPLRMPDEIRKRVEERAAANGRSVNAEIVAILQNAVDSLPAMSSDMDKFVERMADRIAERVAEKLTGK